MKLRATQPAWIGLELHSKILKTKQKLNSKLMFNKIFFTSSTKLSFTRGRS